MLNTVIKEILRNDFARYTEKVNENNNAHETKKTRGKNKLTNHVLIQRKHIVSSLGYLDMFSLPARIHRNNNFALHDKFLIPEFIRSWSNAQYKYQINPTATMKI